MLETHHIFWPTHHNIWAKLILSFKKGGLKTNFFSISLCLVDPPVKRKQTFDSKPCSLWSKFWKENEEVSSWFQRGKDGCSFEGICNPLYNLKKIVQLRLKLNTKLGLHHHHPPTTTNFSKGSRLGRRLRFDTQTSLRLNN